MAKRAATTDLNHENWDKEDEPEDPGIFQPASSDILAGRVIKTAKRRFKADSESELKSSPFSSFTGFGSGTSSSTSSPFSFLSQNKPKTSEGDKNGVKGNNTDSKEFQFKNFSFTAGLKKDDRVGKTTMESLKPFEHIFKPKPSEKEPDKKSTNLELLKELNLSCSSWICEHLGKNPYCILTPIFKDYENHLAKLNLKLDSESKEITILSEKINANNSAEGTKISFKEESSEPLIKDDKEKSAEFKFESSPVEKPFTFQFGNAKPFSDSSTTFSFNQIAAKPVVADSESKNDEDEPEEPPKNEFVPVVEEDSIYDIKCKVFVKKEGSFVSRGVGTLFLKPVKDSSKVQLVVRAHTNLGNILLNVLLTAGMPVQKNGKNNAMLVCIPTPDSKPPPVPVLIRVKTSDECDELIKKLEECRGP